MQTTLAGNFEWHHLDQLGSVRALSDGAGAATAVYDYDPYGNIIYALETGIDDADEPTGSITVDDGRYPGGISGLRYAGEWLDRHTGLYYLRARYYDPAYGQFLTRDPLASLTGQPYLYAAGSPTALTDPLGLAPIEGIGVNIPSLMELPCDDEPNAADVEIPSNKAPTGMAKDPGTWGVTAGLCANGMLAAVGGALLEFCLVTDGGTVAPTLSFGLGVGAAASAGVGVQVTNADSVCDLAGGSVELSGALGVAASLFTNFTSYVGGFVGGGPGAGGLLSVNGTGVLGCETPDGWS